jgi:hypothetical protein
MPRGVSWMTISKRPAINRSSSGSRTSLPPGDSTITMREQFGDRKSSSHSRMVLPATG